MFVLFALLRIKIVLKRKEFIFRNNSFIFSSVYFI